MLIYEVNLKVSNVVINEYYLWLKEHLKDMLEIPGFQSANVFEADTASTYLGNTANENSKDHSNITVQFTVDTKDNLDKYFTVWSKKMRKDTHDKFGKYLSINRRILKVKYNLTKH